MHIVNTIKTYICEYVLINSSKISILQYKKKELFKTKWPYFLNLCRLQIIIGLVQIICNSLLASEYDQFRSIDVCISFTINIIDRCILSRINHKGKLALIIVILNLQSLYLTIFHNHQTLSIELITNLMWMITLIGTQPLFIFKYFMFLSYYLYFCYFLAFWQQNFYDFIIVILIFVLFTVSEEEKFRKLIQNQIIPQQIINSLPQPIFLIKLSTLELLICNDQFKQFIFQFNGQAQNIIQDTLQRFESYGKQKILDLDDSESLNLFETIQVIKLKQSILQSFSYQFTFNDKVYDARFQSNIMYNDDRCVLVSLSDISVVIERAKLTERTILKSKLIKSLSHELRTRKNIIQGLLKLHLDNCKEENNNELIFQAYNNSKIESNIISSILNYNLCLDNQITLKYQQIKVNEYLEKTLENFKYDLKQKSISVLCNHYPETDYSLFTDPELFEQIITNIISNSIKHCDKGNQSILSISVSKETYPITQQISSNHKIAYKPYIKSQNHSSFQSFDCSQQLYETTLNIKIVDNGSGIQAQKLKLIQQILENDNYYQFAQSSSDGFYLGLRSCNLLLQKLNKSNRVDIQLRSKEREETEVVLKFIIHEYDQIIAIEDNIQKVRICNPKQLHICDCLQAILIVDDEPFNNLVLEQILKSLGFRVKKALNGLDALQIYRQQNIQCKNMNCKLFYAIFMDYQMPVMNGLECTRAIIDECNRWKRIQTDIIGCTAFSATEDITQLIKAGMKSQRFHQTNFNDHMNNQFTNNSDYLQICTEILQKPYKLRKQRDIQILQLATQNIKFFQEILQEEGIQVLHKCLSRLQLEIHPEVWYLKYQSTIVFEKGDKGRDFYIILSGQVGIYIFSQNIESNQSLKIPIRQSIKDQVNQLIKQGTRPKAEHSIEIRKILMHEKTKKLLKVNELHEGDSFGERALINEAARLATVVCETECYFGVLNKQDYREILQLAQSEKIQSQITELQSIQGFQGMSRKLLTILLYAFQSQEYKFRDNVYKQGQSSKQEIYLILSGEFMITQDKKIKTYNPFRINYQGVKSIAILQKGSVFGDKEAFQQIELRTQTITCNSDYGKVLCIQLSSLQQRLQANNEMHLINELKQQSEIKEVSREIRTNLSQLTAHSPRRPKSVLYQNSPNHKIDEIVKQKKKIFKLLNKDVKEQAQFIFDINLPRSRTPIQTSSQVQTRQIRRGSAIEKIYCNPDIRTMKRKSFDQTTSQVKHEIRRFSFF